MLTGYRVYQDRAGVIPSAARDDTYTGRWMCACTKLTAMDPSPTAEATRFAEPLRTSPAAKTPGRLVSSRKGDRAASRQRSRSVVPGGSPGPVSGSGRDYDQHCAATHS